MQTNAITGTTDWTQVEVEFDTGSNATIQINCLLGGWGQSTGRAWFDDIKLERLGDFRIVREIGRGGMGIVYEAEQESLGRRVAVKVLPRQSLLDSRHLARFEREARIAAGLHHTNIVQVHGVGEQDGYHYYVMQLVRRSSRARAEPQSLA